MSGLPKIRVAFFLYLMAVIILISVYNTWQYASLS